MNQNRAVVLMLACVTFFVAVCGVAAADRAEAQKGDAIKLDPLDEVIINAHAHNVKLYQLRKEIEKAEDTFYEAFNHVNTEPQYETHCLDQVSTNGRWREHVCKPQFVHSATEDEAHALVGEHTDGLPCMGCMPLGVREYRARPAIMVINERMPAYKKHIRDLVEKDPKLRKALGHYYALTQRYEAVLKEK